MILLGNHWKYIPFINGWRVTWLDLEESFSYVVSYIRTYFYLSFIDQRVDFFLMEISGWEYTLNVELLTISGPSCSEPGIDH